MTANLIPVRVYHALHISNITTEPEILVDKNGFNLIEEPSIELPMMTMVF